MVRRVPAWKKSTDEEPAWMKSIDGSMLHTEKGKIVERTLQPSAKPRVQC